jgi:hypothetical protein
LGAIAESICHIISRNMFEPVVEELATILPDEAAGSDGERFCALCIY